MSSPSGFPLNVRLLPGRRVSLGVKAFLKCYSRRYTGGTCTPGPPGFQEGDRKMLGLLQAEATLPLP